MEDVLPTKPELPGGWQDASVGEPYIIRDALLNTFDMDSFKIPVEEGFWNYPTPGGYTPLVKLLEDKYQAPVVVTCGAKQGLAASMYAVSKLGYNKLALKKPYWCLIPPLADLNRLELQYAEVNETKLPYLLVSPNNPNGAIPTQEQVSGIYEEISDGHWYNHRPIIHDAAYNSPVYLPPDFRFPQKFGDVQIYSSSKMLGLSSLRAGFCVCHTSKYYDLIKSYVDHMTVGVSLLSQRLLYEILFAMQNSPEQTKKFETTSYNALRQSKLLMKEVSPEVLEVPYDFENSPGMFGFFKVGPKADFVKSKLNISDGKLYGMPGYIRMNLAFDSDKIKEIVNRLNSVVQ